MKLNLQKQKSTSPGLDKHEKMRSSDKPGGGILKNKITGDEQTDYMSQFSQSKQKSIYKQGTAYSSLHQ